MPSVSKLHALRKDMMDAMQAQSRFDYAGSKCARKVEARLPDIPSTQPSGRSLADLRADMMAAQQAQSRADEAPMHAFAQPRYDRGEVRGRAQRTKEAISAPTLL